MPNNVESAQDRQNEVNALEYLCTDCSLSYKQTKQYCRWDADLFKDEKLYAIVEIKCRTFKHDLYPDFMFKVDKWEANKAAAKKLNVKFVIIFQYTDGLYVIDETNRTLVGRKQSSIVMKNSVNGRAENVFFTPISELKHVIKEK